MPDHGDFDTWISDLGLMFSASMTPETRRIAEDAMANLSERDLRARRVAPPRPAIPATTCWAT